MSYYWGNCLSNEVESFDGETLWVFWEKKFKLWNYFLLDYYLWLLYGLLRQTISLQIFWRLSSTKFTWSILEHFDSFVDNNSKKQSTRGLCQACNFIKKDTLAQVFSCELSEISKNNFFTEHLQWLLLNCLLFSFIAYFAFIKRLNFLTIKRAILLTEGATQRCSKKNAANLQENTHAKVRFQ